MEELFDTIPKQKVADNLRADFRKRLAKLKEPAQIHKTAALRGKWSVETISYEGDVVELRL